MLGFSAGADEADLEGNSGQYWRLVWEIKQPDPSFVILNSSRREIDGLTRQGRDNLINSLLMERAAAYYRMRGDVGRLQVETLRFLQNAVDAAYEEAVAAADAGRLWPRLSREEAIGNWIDRRVPKGLRQMFDHYDVRYGPGADVIINNRDYATRETGRSYRLPDAKIGDVSFDWTLWAKTIRTEQIRGFFRAIRGRAQWSSFVRASLGETTPI